MRHERANHNRQVRRTIRRHKTQSTRIHAASAILQTLNNLHGRRLRGPSHRTAREARPRGSHRGNSLAQARADRRYQLMHRRIALHAHEHGHAHRVRLGNQRQVITQQVHDHEVLSAGLLIATQPCRCGGVFFRSSAASNRALNRLRLGVTLLIHAQKTLRRRRKHRKIAAPQIRRIGRGVVGALAAVQFKEKLRARVLDARTRLRGQAHLVAIALVNFVLTSVHGVHVGFRGRCREEQGLGELGGIYGGAVGGNFRGTLPRRAQQLLRRLAPRLIAHQPATRRNPRASMLVHQVAYRRQPQRIRGRRLMRRQVARHRVAVLHAHGGTRLIAEIAHVTATQTRGQTGCRRGIRVHARCAGERRLQLGEGVFPARLSRRTRRIHAQGRQLRRNHTHIRGNRHGRLLARRIQPEGILGTGGQ